METSAPCAGSQLMATATRHSMFHCAKTLWVPSQKEVAEIAVSSQQKFGENFDSLNLVKFAEKQPWWHKLLGQESEPSAKKYSVATQLLIGGVTGWCTGFIFQKVGKLAAAAVGCGFFLFQLGNHTGYIKVNWQRVEKDMKKAKEQLKIPKSNQIPNEVKDRAEVMVSFVKKNILMTGGFFGGLLLNVTS
ncbi:FUN14 domain-containing protein 2-like [Orycteropus afer afer]|uniref:FUN14 domain-containing protein 2-like n=1 Tax=Orycteropus afer afer TaxID=1230840 RepID=A0AC54ZBN6_ORYAF|nr:FUN14 domain-containing protein 2-like [Orycteropus afer afer]